MRFAVCLYKYFPFGGLARDFMRIMHATLKEGDSVDVFVIEWQGDVPDNFNVHIIEPAGTSNHGKLSSFHAQVSSELKKVPYDLVIGFNKMPGIDLYYAADPCYLDRLKSHPFYFLLKYTPRVQFYSACEQAVFGQQSKTVSLMISDVQQALFEQHYATEKQRLISLSPGIDPNRKRPENAAVIREQLRKELNVGDEQWLLLMVGTGFKTKGVDRAIATLAQLPEAIKGKTKLMIIGEGNTSVLTKQAKKLAVAEQVSFLGGRSDVPKFLLAADLLIHPARKENTGTVILEALVAGLPVLVSSVCGYSKHVVKSKAGNVLSDAGDAALSAIELAGMLKKQDLLQWSENALDYAAKEDLYSMPQQAATVIRTMAAQKGNEVIT